MKKLMMVGIATSILTLTGCATQTYVLAPQSEATPSYNKMQHFFVNGIGQEQTVQANEVCGGADKVAKIETQKSFLNSLLGGLSQGIYTPRQAKVYCKN